VRVRHTRRLAQFSSDSVRFAGDYRQREALGEPEATMQCDRYPCLVLPLPERLDKLSEKLPPAVVGILSALATHKASDIAELAILIPDDFLVPPLSEERVSLPRPKEAAYDDYFSVERATDRPRLRFALAFYAPSAPQPLTPAWGTTFTRPR